MNDEIKEILDNIKKCCEIMQDENFVVYQKQDIIKLLDYITNLQQKLEDYKSRIEKAVEYISSNCILSREWKEVEFCKFLATGTITYKALSRGKIKELLDILNGRSDE